MRYSKFHIWPWKFKVKVMAKVKSYGPIWGLNFNWYVCILFRANRTIFGWDIAIQNLTLTIQGQGHGQGQNPWSHLRPSVQSICLLFVLWQSNHFWLRYSKFQSHSHKRIWNFTKQFVKKSFAAIGWVVLTLSWGHGKISPASVA